MIKTKWYIILVIMAIVIVLFIPSSIAKAADVKINQESAIIYVGSTVDLELSEADKSGISWSTSNKKVATVTSSGTVKGKKKGTAVITAAYKGKTYTCNVKVKKPFLNYTDVNMNSGETLELVLTGTTAKKWKSSDKKVVTVNKGKVTAVGEGNATITVTGKDKKKYKLKVSVNSSSKTEAPVVSLDLNTVFSDGKLDKYGDIPKSALKATGYNLKLRDVDFGRTLPDDVRDQLWNGDGGCVMKFSGVTLIEDDKNFPAEDGYFWAKVVFYCELVDRQEQMGEDGKWELVITKDDLKNAKFDEGVTLRFSNDVFSSPIDGKKPGKDGFYTFALTEDGKEYNNCKFKTVVEKDERTWYISRYTVAYMKLPEVASASLFLTAATYDEILESNITTDGLASYGDWGPYRFSPIICSFPVLQAYSEATMSDKMITDYDKELCDILGIEFTGEEFDWDW